MHYTTIKERKCWKIGINMARRANYLFTNIRGLMGAGVVRRPFELVYIKPELIMHEVSNPRLVLYPLIARKRFPIARIGAIKGGRWDMSGKTVDRMDVIIAFSERFKNGKTWQETDFYNRVREEIEVKGLIKWNCKTLREFHERLVRIDELYKDISMDGYKTQRELGKETIDDEIRVCVSHDGRILLVDGRHRLAIARTLGMEFIPVVVSAWHKDYIARYKNLLGNTSPRNLIGPALQAKIMIGGAQ